MCGSYLRSVTEYRDDIAAASTGSRSSKVRAQFAFCVDLKQVLK